MEDSESVSTPERRKWYTRGRVKQTVSQMKETFKARGFKGLFQVYGWKLIVGIFFYYLIRDTILYILIPWFVLQKMIESNPF